MYRVHIERIYPAAAFVSWKLKVVLVTGRSNSLPSTVHSYEIRQNYIIHRASWIFCVFREMKFAFYQFIINPSISPGLEMFHLSYQASFCLDLFCRSRMKSNDDLKIIRSYLIIFDLFFSKYPDLYLHRFLYNSDFIKYNLIIKISDCRNYRRDYPSRDSNLIRKQPLIATGHVSFLSFGKS